MKIKIATSQFSVSSKIENNKKRILAQIDEAKNLSANLIYFPEGSLSGYAGVDFENFNGFDWAELTNATNDIINKIIESGIWVILGSLSALPKLVHIKSRQKSLILTSVKNEKEQIAMVTTKKEKQFDAVKMMREIRDQISYETQNMTFDELKAYIQKQLTENKTKLLGQ
jgi:hypothetical protein